MGFCVDVTKGVSVELRRESFRLIVGIAGSDEIYRDIELDYLDLNAVKAAILLVENSTSFIADSHRRDEIRRVLQRGERIAEDTLLGQVQR